MKILVASYRLPYPVHDGESLRVLAMAKRLAPRHQLDFVGFGDEPTPPELEGVFRAVVRAGPRPAPPPASLGRIFAADRWFGRSAELDRKIGELLARARHDLVWITSMELVPYFTGRSAPPLFIDVLDDAVLENLRDLRQERAPRALLRSLLRTVVAYRFERGYYGGATLAMVSERDAAFIARVVPRAHPVVIHNGVDADHFRPQGMVEHFPSVIFEGTMDFPPNVDAALYLHGEIMPRVRRDEPRALLYVVGRNPSPAVQALADSVTVVTGEVDDVRPYLERASVFACTMRRGAGIKNKILQAWAMERPVVATTIATGGLLLQPGVNLEVADEPRAIAAAIVRLLRDPAARRRLGRAGRQTVIDHYSWERKAGDLERAFEDCVARTEAHAPSPRLLPRKAPRMSRIRAWWKSSS